MSSSVQHEVAYFCAPSSGAGAGAPNDFRGLLLCSPALLYGLLACWRLGLMILVEEAASPLMAVEVSMMADEAAVDDVVGGCRPIEQGGE